MLRAFGVTGCLRLTTSSISLRTALGGLSGKAFVGFVFSSHAWAHVLTDTPATHHSVEVLIIFFGHWLKGVEQDEARDAETPSQTENVTT